MGGRAAHLEGEAEHLVERQLDGGRRRQVVGDQDDGAVESVELAEIETVQRSQDLGRDVEHVELAIGEVLVGQGLETRDQLLEHLVDRPPGIDPVLANHLLDGLGEGWVGGDQLVCLEDRGVLLPHLLRRAVAVFPDALDGGRDRGVKPRDLGLDPVRRHGDPQGRDRPGLVDHGLTDRDPRAHAEAGEGLAH